VEVSDIQAFMAELSTTDVTKFATRDAIVALEHCKSQFDAACSKSLALFESSGTWQTSGAKAAKNWVIKKTRMSGKEVTRQVVRGRELRHLPLFAASWTAGKISGAHMDVVSKLRRPKTKAFLKRDEEMLVTEAERLTFRQFVRFCQYWDQLADPDGVEQAALEREARRDVWLDESFEGTYLGGMTMTSVGGLIVRNELNRLEQELFEEDWAKTKETLGREPLGDEIIRTIHQRRHDALVQMAIRSATAPADGHAPAPLFNVLVDFHTLQGRVCELAQGTVVTPGSLLPWLERADFERATFDPPNRVDIGVKQRLFTGATRRAIAIRDRECQHEFCEESPDRCECDHILEFSKGGLTTQENGRLLCPFHNRLRNRQIDDNQRPPPRE